MVVEPEDYFLLWAFGNLKKKKKKVYTFIESYF